MEEKLNLDNIFTNIANAIREKTKTTDKIKVFDMSKKINEISGSVDLVKPIYAEQKTPVPNSGHLEKFFFRTKKSDIKILEKIFYNITLQIIQ